ncbi:hypothetical protein [uncultured Corynebacterium sp.]|uniref:hypothetical protein n=1 Tax=uncultured Corynebacterium sp. TaxID=159447 RepID=UPI0025CE2600|nr:hypothetical protein [uncultured Corynebacterium sp.]
MKTLWKPSEDWLHNHTTSDLVYTVHLQLESGEAVDRVWEQLVDCIRKDSPENAGSSTVFWGGAHLDRVGDREIEAGSGGEDALDSLDDCINDLLGQAMADAGVAMEVTVISEQRVLSRD